jgi:DNA (cytosine-5)-methyltransferase 1
VNYYNDNDAASVFWLKSLMACGLIPKGEVDSRSIVEVTANDIRGFTQCHFFTGIGGWPYALKLVGWPYHRRVWTGSCPCQPFSVAGKRKGAEDERHLWPEFLRLITECKPPVVFGEQVASKDGRQWLSGVRADLEGVGYAVGAADLCAAGVGAPHIRQRLYWVANRNFERLEGRRVFSRDESIEWKTGYDRSDNGAADAVHAERRTEYVHGQDVSDGDDAGRTETRSVSGARNKIHGVADGERGGRQGRDGSGTTAVQLRTDGSTDSGVVDSKDSVRWRTDGEIIDRGRSEKVGGPSVADKMGDDDDDDDAGLPPRGVIPIGVAERSQQSAYSSAWSQYTIAECREPKRGVVYRRVPVEPAFFPLAHGVPGRVAQLRGLGNAIVPQVAAAFVEAFMETE